MKKTKLDSLNAELQEKSARAMELLDKPDDDRSAAETKEAYTLSKRVEELREEITQEKALQKFKGSAAELKAWMETADRTLPFGGKAAGYLGSKDAGRTTFDLGDPYGSYKDVGPGAYGEKTWQGLKTKEYADALTKSIRLGRDALSPEERKDLSVGSDTEGGNFAPAEWLPRIISREPHPTTLASRFTRLTTGRNRLTMAYVNNTSDANNIDVYSTGIRVTKTGENPNAGQAKVTDSNIAGVASIDVNTFMMTATLTNEAVEDPGFDLIQFITGKFGETYRLFGENMALNGIGRNEPFGIYSKIGAAENPVPHVFSGAAGALSYDGFIDAYTDVPVQYDMNACWVTHKKHGYRAALKLKDSAGRPLLSKGVDDSGLELARTRTIEGAPVLFSPFMPAVGAANYPFLYGDLAGYYQVDRVGLSIQVLREVKAELNQVLIVARFRMGGAVLEPWRIRALKSNQN